MKKIVFILLAFFSVVFASAQNVNPVSWTFSSKKISDKDYELQLVATIQQGWHLYSQTQPEDAIAQPTSFNFNKNPLVTIDGKVKEMGCFCQSIQQQSSFCVKNKNEGKSKNQCNREAGVSNV